MTKSIKIFLISLLWAAPLLLSCTDSDDVGDSYKTFTGQTIKDFLDANPQYSNFEQALDRVDGLSLMASYGTYTVFLPDNDAVASYVQENGFGSFEQFLDSVSAVKNMVYYHIIDGESNSADTYTTTEFKIGNIETKNMLGRYIYTSVSDDGATWLVNSTSRITQANNVMVNGVVHLVDRVVTGNNDLISTTIEDDARFSLYAEALKATGLADSLSLIEDDSYQTSTTATSPAEPTRREYGYTLLLESADVLAANGITTLDDMRAYAKAKYPEATNTDETATDNSLYMFVAYHIVPYKLTTSQLCPNRNMTVGKTFYDAAWMKENFRDGKYFMDSYLFPMAPNTLINVQQFIWGEDEIQNPIFNDPRNPYDPQWTNMNAEATDVCTVDIDNSNIDCLNGVIHTITEMLYYREDIYHKRLRMDFSLFFPEFWNNDLAAGDNRHYTIPYGYFKNLSYEQSDDKLVRYWKEYGGHSYMLGDNFDVKGQGDYTITVGPIPSGRYEVRIGYHVRAEDYGIVQYYLDGEPCGIPLDMRISAHKSTKIGWNQSWYYIVNDPGYREGWNSGRETSDDYYGYDNDKSMHNLGYMKAPDCYTAREMANSNFNPVHVGTARNDPYSVRRVLGIFTWDKTQSHRFTISNLMDGRSFDLDYIEFMPTDLIEDEDTH